MKKILSTALILVLLSTGLFILTGCKNNNEEKENTSTGYNKEVETQNIQTIDGTGSISFEFEKNDKYTVTPSSNKITIKNSENYAEVKVTALHDSIFSATVTKKEKDFYSDKYHDYKEITVGNYTGWEIYKGESEYETVLVLSEKEKDTNKVYAVDVQVTKSPVMKENMTFDTAEFVKGEDFQHLLNSIKLTVNEVNE